MLYYIISAGRVLYSQQNYPVFANVNFPAFSNSTEICKLEKDKIEDLFQNLDLDYPGLQTVKNISIP